MSGQPNFAKREKIRKQFYRPTVYTALWITRLNHDLIYFLDYTTSCIRLRNFTEWKLPTHACIGLGLYRDIIIGVIDQGRRPLRKADIHRYSPVIKQSLRRLRGEISASQMPAMDSVRLHAGWDTCTFQNGAARNGSDNAETCIDALELMRHHRASKSHVDLWMLILGTDIFHITSLFAVLNVGNESCPPPAITCR